MMIQTMAIDDDDNDKESGEDHKTRGRWNCFRSIGRFSVY